MWLRFVPQRPKRPVLEQHASGCGQVRHSVSRTCAISYISDASVDRGAEPQLSIYYLYTPSSPNPAIGVSTTQFEPIPSFPTLTLTLTLGLTLPMYAWPPCHIFANPLVYQVSLQDACVHPVRHVQQSQPPGQSPALAHGGRRESKAELQQFHVGEQQRLAFRYIRFFLLIFLPVTLTHTIHNYSATSNRYMSCGCVILRIHRRH